MIDIDLRLEKHRGRRLLVSARRRRTHDGHASLSWTIWLWAFNSEGELGWWRS